MSNKENSWGMVNSLFLFMLAAPAALPLTTTTTTTTTTSHRLNVLLLIADDLRNELGVYGGAALTPALDALARKPGSVVFDRAYVQQAICCPTRSSFLTGRRPDTTRVWDLKTQFRDAPGAAGWKTLPQAFRDAGYETAGMGKVFHPVPWRNESDDVAGGSWSLPYFQPGRGEDNRYPLRATNCGVANAAVQDEARYTDGMTAAHAVATLRNLSSAAKMDPKKAKKPFFVAVGFHRPHLPWIVPQKYFDLYANRTIALADHRERPAHYNATGAMSYSWDPQSGPRHCLPLANATRFPGEYDYVPDNVALHFRRSYYAAVSFFDHLAGTVLAELEALGLHKTTVVAVVGDHGWQLGDLGEFGKKTNFERATRAPLIVHDPVAGMRFSEGSSGSEGSKASGPVSDDGPFSPLLPRPATRSRALVEFVDLMPTLYELAVLRGANGDSASPSVDKEPLEVAKEKNKEADAPAPARAPTPAPALLSAGIPTCPPDSSHVALCTEGQSLVPILADPDGPAARARTAAFMQYAACMHDDGIWHDGCAADSEPRVMGYAIRTRRWRYVEWVHFEKGNATAPPTPRWDLPQLGSELYDHGADDPGIAVNNAAEAVNVVADPALASTVEELRRQLRAGWRAHARR